MIVAVDRGNGRSSGETTPLPSTHTQTPYYPPAPTCSPSPSHQRAHTLYSYPPTLPSLSSSSSFSPAYSYPTLYSTLLPPSHALAPGKAPQWVEDEERSKADRRLQEKARAHPPPPRPLSSSTGTTRCCVPRCSAATASSSTATLKVLLLPPRWHAVSARQPEQRPPLHHLEDFSCFLSSSPPPSA